MTAADGGSGCATAAVPVAGQAAGAAGKATLQTAAAKLANGRYPPGTAPRPWDKPQQLPAAAGGKHNSHHARKDRERPAPGTAPRPWDLPDGLVNGRHAAKGSAKQPSPEAGSRRILADQQDPPAKQDARNASPRQPQHRDAQPDEAAAERNLGDWCEHGGPRSQDGHRRHRSAHGSPDDEQHGSRHRSRHASDRHHDRHHDDDRDWRRHSHHDDEQRHDRRHEDERAWRHRSHHNDRHERRHDKQHDAGRAHRHDRRHDEDGRELRHSRSHHRDRDEQHRDGGSRRRSPSYEHRHRRSPSAEHGEQHGDRSHAHGSRRKYDSGARPSSDPADGHAPQRQPAAVTAPTRRAQQRPQQNGFGNRATAVSGAQPNGVAHSTFGGQPSTQPPASDQPARAAATGGAAGMQPSAHGRQTGASHAASQPAMLHQLPSLPQHQHQPQPQPQLYVQPAVEASAARQTPAADRTADQARSAAQPAAAGAAPAMPAALLTGRMGSMTAAAGSEDPLGADDDMDMSAAEGSGADGIVAEAQRVCEAARQQAVQARTVAEEASANVTRSQAAMAKAEREHQAAVTAAQHHGRSPLQEPLWTYNEAGGSARGQRGPFSLLSLLAMMRDPQHVVEENTLICDEDGDEAVTLGHKLAQFPIAVATWDRRVSAAAAAAATADRAAQLQAQWWAAQLRHDAASAALAAAHQAHTKWQPAGGGTGGGGGDGGSGGGGRGLTPTEVQKLLQFRGLEGGFKLWSADGGIKTAQQVVDAWQAALNVASATAAAGGSSLQAAPPQQKLSLRQPADGVPAFTAAEPCWTWVSVDGQQQGPFCLDQLHQWVASGLLRGDMQASHVRQPAGAPRLTLRAIIDRHAAAVAARRHRAQPHVARISSKLAHQLAQRVKKDRLRVLLPLLGDGLKQFLVVLRAPPPPPSLQTLLPPPRLTTGSDPAAGTMAAAAANGLTAAGDPSAAATAVAPHAAQAAQQASAAVTADPGNAAGSAPASVTQLPAAVGLPPAVVLPPPSRLAAVDLQLVRSASAPPPLTQKTPPPASPQAALRPPAASSQPSVLLPAAEPDQQAGAAAAVAATSGSISVVPDSFGEADLAAAVAAVSDDAMHPSGVGPAARPAKATATAAAALQPAAQKTAAAEPEAPGAAAMQLKAAVQPPAHASLLKHSSGGGGSPTSLSPKQAVAMSPSGGAGETLLQGGQPPLQGGLLQGGPSACRGGGLRVRLLDKGLAQADAAAASVAPAAEAGEAPPQPAVAHADTVAAAAAAAAAAGPDGVNVRWAGTPAAKQAVSMEAAATTPLTSPTAAHAISQQAVAPPSAPAAGQQRQQQPEPVAQAHQRSSEPQAAPQHQQRRQLRLATTMQEAAAAPPPPAAAQRDAALPAQAPTLAPQSDAAAVDGQQSRLLQLPAQAPRPPVASSSSEPSEDTSAADGRGDAASKPRAAGAAGPGGNDAGAAAAATAGLIGAAGTAGGGGGNSAAPEQPAATAARGAKKRRSGAANADLVPCPSCNIQMPATRVAGHITSCLRKMELAAEKEAKAKRIAEEAEIARTAAAVKREGILAARRASAAAAEAARAEALEDAKRHAAEQSAAPMTAAEAAGAAGLDVELPLAAAEAAAAAGVGSVAPPAAAAAPPVVKGAVTCETAAFFAAAEVAAAAAPAAGDDAAAAAAAAVGGGSDAAPSAYSVPAARRRKRPSATSADASTGATVSTSADVSWQGHSAQQVPAAAAAAAAAVGSAAGGDETRTKPTGRAGGIASCPPGDEHAPPRAKMRRLSDLQSCSADVSSPAARHSRSGSAGGGSSAGNASGSGGSATTDFSQIPLAQLMMPRRSAAAAARIKFQPSKRHAPNSHAAAAAPSGRRRRLCDSAAEPAALPPAAVAAAAAAAAPSSSRPAARPISRANPAAGGGNGGGTAGPNLWHASLAQFVVPQRRAAAAAIKSLKEQGAALTAGPQPDRHDTVDATGRQSRKGAPGAAAAAAAGTKRKAGGSSVSRKHVSAADADETAVCARALPRDESVARACTVQAKSLAGGGVKAVAAAAAAAGAAAPGLHRCKVARRQAMLAAGPAEKALVGRKVERQPLRLGSSKVHAWGLYAKEPIPADTLVIEYVGERLRRPLDDIREKAYEAKGMDSSYLFRVDNEWVVDATVKGGMARFINHSCDPNCVTKVVQVDGCGHIVIYSRRAIAKDEELCYDYKFEHELDQPPVPCNCGARNCRKRMN